MTQERYRELINRIELLKTDIDLVLDEVLKELEEKV